MAGVSVKQEKPDVEAVGGDGGDADLLLDTILRNALGGGDDAKKGDGVKGESAKKEGVKGETVKGEHPIKSEQLTLKGESTKGEKTKGENAKGENAKGENAKREGAKLEGVKSDIKGEHHVKMETSAIAPMDKKNKKRSRSGKKKKRSRSRKKRKKTSPPQQQQPFVQQESCHSRSRWPASGSSGRSARTLGTVPQSRRRDLLQECP